MQGRLNNLIVGRGCEQYLTLAIRADFREEYDRLKDADLDIEIKKHHEKRSLNANAYCWVLCDKISEALNDGTSRIDVYRNAIRESGVCTVVNGLSLADPTIMRILRGWDEIGIGFFHDPIDEDSAIYYYGSSRYNTKQMARLLDNLIQDAKALGITTETPDEIERMKALWGRKDEK